MSHPVSTWVSAGRAESLERVDDDGLLLQAQRVASGAWIAMVWSSVGPGDEEPRLRAWRFGLDAVQTAKEVAAALAHRLRQHALALGGSVTSMARPDDDLLYGAGDLGSILFSQGATTLSPVEGPDGSSSVRA